MSVNRVAFNGETVIREIPLMQAYAHLGELGDGFEFHTDDVPHTDGSTAYECDEQAEYVASTAPSGIEDQPQGDWVHKYSLLERIAHKYHSVRDAFDGRVASVRGAINGTLGLFSRSKHETPGFLVPGIQASTFTGNFNGGMSDFAEHDEVMRLRMELKAMRSVISSLQAGIHELKARPQEPVTVSAPVTAPPQTVFVGDPSCAGGAGGIGGPGVSLSYDDNGTPSGVDQECGVDLSEPMAENRTAMDQVSDLTARAEAAERKAAETEQKLQAAQADLAAVRKVLGL